MAPPFGVTPSFYCFPVVLVLLSRPTLPCDHAHPPSQDPSWPHPRLAKPRPSVLAPPRAPQPPPGPPCVSLPVSAAMPHRGHHAHRPASPSRRPSCSSSSEKVGARPPPGRQPRPLTAPSTSGPPGLRELLGLRAGEGRQFPASPGCCLGRQLTLGPTRPPSSPSESGNRASPDPIGIAVTLSPPGALFKWNDFFEFEVRRWGDEGSLVR